MPVPFEHQILLAALGQQTIRFGDRIGLLADLADRALEHALGRDELGLTQQIVVHVARVLDHIDDDLFVSLLLMLRMLVLLVLLLLELLLVRESGG